MLLSNSVNWNFWFFLLLSDCLNSPDLTCQKSVFSIYLSLVNLKKKNTHRINLVEYLPLLVRDPQFLRCLDRPSQLARPHLQIRQIVLIDELSQGVGKLRRDRQGF